MANEGLLKGRKEGFEKFYEELMPTLVDFIDRLGIRPAHEVLKQAPSYLRHLSPALQDLTIEGDEDRVWLLTRLGYFIGEFFAQRYEGHWYVEENVKSPLFARYVVGRFRHAKAGATVDPFEVARRFIDSPVPRDLQTVLDDVSSQVNTPT